MRIITKEISNRPKMCDPYLAFCSIKSQQKCLSTEMAGSNNTQNHGLNGLKQPQVVVVMVPFPLQGHLNQLLHLSRLISSYNIPVHYVSTATHNRQAKLRVHGWNPLSKANIHFHEFPTANFPNPPPNPNTSLKFPAHLQPSFDASADLRGPISALFRALSARAKRVVIINDSLMGSVVQDFLTLSNAESYTFHSVSAFSIFFFMWERMENPFPVDKEILKILPPMDGCFTPEFSNFVKAQHNFVQFNSGRIYNSCKVIEGTYLDLLSKEEISQNKKQWALGPFNPVHIMPQKSGPKEQNNERHKCLQWLDRQNNNSVIFVSFGTTTSISDEQIRELAFGLERSAQKFLWVLRDADSGDVFVQETRKLELPKGFERRVEGRGLVVRNWAPQLEILGHSATGGFMSHCGWNSCMESITMGVPMATWPMHSDQPRNAVLITKILKVGLQVKDWAHKDELVTSSKVEKAVRMLMAEEEGQQMRKRSAEMGAAVRTSLAEGGVTRMELDSFIAHITR
ncbi:zeatin O-glucosyltransferase-like [Coffea arabica]|uniref:Glycosyltransferase n=1 Tax=Coffea arabica TaxID=13443 RepID=A0A6P6SWY9_COFAR